MKRVLSKSEELAGFERHELISGEIENKTENKAAKCVELINAFLSKLDLIKHINQANLEILEGKSRGEQKGTVEFF